MITVLFFFVLFHRLPDGQFTKVKCQHHLQENEQNSPPGANKTDVLLFLVCLSYTVPVFVKGTQNAVSF